MLKIKLEEGGGRSRDELEHIIFSQEFLLKRPLLDAIMSDGAVPPVLLIDEVDRSDEEFEAFLLEVLSDFQITIPEIGTIKAGQRPFVILTSNRTREIHDALKRRCLYLWIDYPSFEKEYQIVLAKVPGIRDGLAEQICQFMQKLRQVNFYKRPGVAETLDWAQALLHLNQMVLVPETIRETVGCFLKYHEDVEKFKRDEMDRILLEF
jgi:MoxR-like ATPase